MTEIDLERLISEQAVTERYRKRLKFWESALRNYYIDGVTNAQDVLTKSTFLH